MDKRGINDDIFSKAAARAKHHTLAQFEFSDAFAYAMDLHQPRTRPRITLP